MPSHLPGEVRPAGSASDGSRQAFLAYVADRRREVDAALTRHLPAPPACPAPLAEAMAYAVGTGGKRFRPLLALAAADAVINAASGPSPRRRAEARTRVLPAACAVEFVHAQSLVHDDLPSMDNDTLRRGQPTVHVRFGEALAILAGDGLLAEAFALLARAGAAAVTPGERDRWLRVVGELGQAVGASGMAGGQAIDLACTPGAVACTSMDLPALRDMHVRKTGGLIRVAAVAGALLAGGTEAQVEAIGAFAADVGLAFQIVDDILDVEGTTGAVGKTSGKDAAAGKPTYPALVGLPRSYELAAAAVDRAERGLAEAGLVDHHLLDLAAWVLTRRC
jgi:geranylgeranyl pyrophosphate synthase